MKYSTPTPYRYGDWERWFFEQLYAGPRELWFVDAAWFSPEAVS